MHRFAGTGRSRSKAEGSWQAGFGSTWGNAKQGSAGKEAISEIEYKERLRGMDRSR